MLEIKKLLEQTGCRVKENFFKRPPPLPYIVYLADEAIRGADCANCIRETDFTVELYAENVDAKTEKKIEDILNELNAEYQKNRVWLEEEKMLQTTYDFSVTEKMEGETWR